MIIHLSLLPSSSLPKPSCLPYSLVCLFNSTSFNRKRWFCFKGFLFRLLNWNLTSSLFAFSSIKEENFYGRYYWLHQSQPFIDNTRWSRLFRDFRVTNFELAVKLLWNPLKCLCISNVLFGTLSSWLKREKISTCWFLFGRVKNDPSFVTMTLFQRPGPGR